MSFLTGQIPWNKGISPSPLTRAKMSIAAKKRSPEHLAKISAALKGRPLSMEHRAKLSAAHKQRYMDPENRKKTGESSKKYFALPGMRERQSKILKRALTSPEARKIKSDAAMKCNADPDKRKKHSETIKKYYEDPAYRKKMGECVKKALARPDVHEKMSGPNHRLWRGGMHKSYGLGFNDELKTMVRKRDDYLCQIPGCYLPENGRHHAVHHIDYQQSHNHPINLITLCIKCHTKTTYGDREYWAGYLQALQEIRGIAEP